jgi:hypothetical protein
VAAAILNFQKLQRSEHARRSRVRARIYSGDTGGTVEPKINGVGVDIEPAGRLLEVEVAVGYVVVGNP